MDRSLNGYTHVKVFSATMLKERDQLGERVSDWIATPGARPIEIVDTVVRQSSDSQFHCLSITVFYRAAK